MAKILLKQVGKSLVIETSEHKDQGLARSVISDFFDCFEEIFSRIKQ